MVHQENTLEARKSKADPAMWCVSLGTQEHGTDTETLKYNTGRGGGRTLSTTKRHFLFPHKHALCVSTIQSILHVQHSAPCMYNTAHPVVSVATCTRGGESVQNVIHAQIDNKLRMKVGVQTTCHAVMHERCDVSLCTGAHHTCN